MKARWKTLATVFSCGVLLPTLSFAAPRVEPEILGGFYPLTVRNRRTEGVTLACRLWFPRGEESGAFLLDPRPLVWGVEIRTGWLYRPETAGEKALLALLKYEAEITADFSIYGFIGGGGSYSSACYDRTTHGNFVTRAGIGFLLRRFLLQAVVEHRSNARLSSRNRGVDLLSAEAGFHF